MVRTLHAGGEPAFFLYEHARAPVAANVVKSVDVTGFIADNVFACGSKVSIGR
jgi:hypothetical protein